METPDVQTEQATVSVAPNRYYIQTGSSYLAVSGTEIVTQAGVYIWNVSSSGQHNSILDPGTNQYLSDDGSDNVLSPTNNDHAAWRGASTVRPNTLQNRATSNNLVVPRPEGSNRWYFIRARS
ncbi:11.9 kDa wall protein [Tuber indicum]|nr:11.9 kDa wall protein [Tuber indicum]